MTARLLTIMGSGETSPTMVKVHRSLLERLEDPVRAVLLDTPFGFQENAAEIAGRAVAYFQTSLGTGIEVASSSDTPGDTRPADPAAADTAFEYEHLTSRIRAARYVFAGPGSPTYALRKWRGTVVPQLLAEKLEHGGAVTFASAAALTLGVATVPVYEIYKVGEDPRWLDGLDLLAVSGINAAVIPHYNNSEGGTHDTRYCYLGERRLVPMERELPDGAFVLGVDEHTALVLDLDAGSGSVAGIGVVTVRAAGRSATFATGTTAPIGELVETAERLRAGGAGAAGRAGGGGGVGGGGRVGGGGGVDGLAAAFVADPAGASAGDAGDGGAAGRGSASPLLTVVRAQEEAFSAAIASRDPDEAVRAILELEAEIIDWSTDIPDGNALDRARASLRSMIVELGKLAAVGARDPAGIVGPFVEALLELRRRAREDRRYDESDRIRDELLELGVEVRDTASGTEWALAGG